MATLPSALALTTIADGSPIIAADPRNNFSAIQTDVNGILTILGGGTSGQVLQSGGGTTVNWLGAYTTYAPTWTSTGTQPVLGNGGIVGHYQQVGKMIQGFINMTVGSTSTFGTGTYIWSTPVAINAVVASSFPLGPAMANHAGSVYMLTAIVGGGGILIATPASPAVLGGPTVPFTFASGDNVQINFTYEAA